jgi:hypothetical protein
MSSHPSYLLLDRLALGAHMPELDAHVAECERCKSHLHALDQPLEIPAWARALEREPRSSFFQNLRGRFVFGSLALATAAAALLIVVRPQHYDGSKGAPSIAVYIRHGEQVSLWDGRASLRAGDAIRLKVSASGYSHLSVALADGGTLSPLFDGAVSPRGETALPNSWALDNAPGPERLLIVFSDATLGRQDLELATHEQQRNKEIWSTLLVLDKNP